MAELEESSSESDSDSSSASGTDSDTKASRASKIVKKKNSVKSVASPSPKTPPRTPPRYPVAAAAPVPEITFQDIDLLSPMFSQACSVSSGTSGSAQAVVLQQVAVLEQFKMDGSIGT